MRFLTRRPRLVVGIWIVLVAALAFHGRGLEEKVASRLPFIDGTAAKRAHEIAVREFGGEDAMVVMLRGPRTQVERQGKELARRLGEMPRTRVVSPWEAGVPAGGLRPRPEVAALVVRVERDDDEEVTDLLPPVQKQVDETVSGPVDPSIAGIPVIVDSYSRASAHAAEVGEMIAIPVLLLVLLLVFRSVIAAIMPVVVGGAVVAASQGVLTMMLGFVPVDPLALGAIGMIGLALGVDYSLLVVSRFREEAKHREKAEAVEVTVRRTARSVLPAGCGLALATVAALLVLPSAFGVGISVAIMVATVLSVISALCVTPALLMLLGDNLDRWSLRERPRSEALSLRWSRWVGGRPRAVASIMAALLLCAGLAVMLRSEVATIELLPTGDPGRQQQEEVEKALGPGWLAPMEVVVSSDEEPLTAPEKLDALAAFQRRIERDPGVEAVAGLRPLEAGADRFAGIEDSLAEGEQGLERLETGLSRAHDGAALGATGLAAAAEGSRQLDSGLSAANGGAGLLADALQAAGAGSGRLTDGLGSVEEGSGKLSEGASKVSTGATRLAEGLDRAREGTDEIIGSAELYRNAMLTGEERLAELGPPLSASEAQLAAAWEALQRMTAGRSDPEYAAALRAVQAATRSLGGVDPATGELADPSYEGIGAGIELADGQFEVGRYLAARQEKTGEQARKGIARLAQGSAKLDRGLRRLAAGTERLSSGIEKLSRGGEQLPPALLRLSDGAGQLEDGLVQLGAGAGQLADGLGDGAQKTKLLAGGLGRIGTALSRSREEGGGLDQLQAQSPGFFRSGYLVLAGLDGSSPQRREQASLLINLDRGGQDARMLVIPNDEPFSTESRKTVERLETDAAGLSRETGTEVLVGGAGPNVIAINDALREQGPVLRLVLALVTFLILLPVVRSVTLALLGALLNLITVSATFGLLVLLFNTSLLGGPGYIDATVIPMIVMLIFGLAIDYEVFVFARIREEYVRTGSTSLAIRNGLDHTAHVVSGAAMIMILVFLSFSVSGFPTMRNFGVAQAIGVALDAFVIRLVVVPALMGWLGEWSWWPRRLSGRSRVRPAQG